MKPDFELKPVPAGTPPGYPAAPAPGEPPRAPMISNRLSRWAPLAMLAIGGSTLVLPASRRATAQEAAGPAATADPAPSDGVKRLSEAEVKSLVENLEVQRHRMQEIDGDRIAIMGILTEVEAKRVVEAFLRKNGLDPLPRRIMRPGVDFEADAWDRERGIGVEVLGAKDATAWGGEPQPAEGDLSAEEQEELSLLRARGEVRLLILHGADYTYDSVGDYTGTLPTKYGAVMRLLADLEKFLQESER